MEQTPRTKERRRRRLLAFLTMATLVGSITSMAFSLAVFTDTQTVGANAFTTGTVALGVNPATAVLSSTSLMPGDTVNGSLVVSNAGTAALRYAISGSSTDPDTKSLNTQLAITIKAQGTSCAAFDGATLFSGTIVSATSVPLVGNPAQGADAGDRPLAGSTNETLCFRAHLPIETGNAYKLTSTTYTFVFDAEQTANN